jgi:hypothetical protein
VDGDAATDASMRLERVKWHLVRYDNLHATAASKASTVLSANALVPACASVLIGQVFGGQTGPMTWQKLMIAVGGVTSLIFVALSVVTSAQGLLALRPWRRRFRQNVPIEPFFSAQ